MIVVILCQHGIRAVVKGIYLSGDSYIPYASAIMSEFKSYLTAKLSCTKIDYALNFFVFR